MKNSILKICSFVIMAFGVVSCSGGNPVEYNNKIITILNNLQDDQIAMNNAMTSDDFAKAEASRVEWMKNLDKSIEEITKIGDFKGDSSFKDAVLESLNQYKGLVSNEYKELIDIRKSNGPQEKENALLDKINEILSSISDKINKASSEFEKKVTA